MEPGYVMYSITAMVGDAKATKLTLRIVVFLGRAHIACFMRAALYELPPLRRRRLAATIMASTFIKI